MRREFITSTAVRAHVAGARLVAWMGRGMAPEDRADRRLLVVLLAIDLCFIALHAIHATTSLIDDPLFSIHTIRSYPEWFQYVKELSIVVLLALVAAARRKSLYAVFSSMYLYLLLDDSLELHEALGRHLATTYGFEARFGLRPVDFGELAVSVAAGALFLGPVALAYLRSDEATRAAGRWLIALTALLGFFGVVVDMARFASRGLLRQARVILEDGGEMFVMSAVTAFCVGLLSASLRASAPARRAAVDQ